jgi:hypothetical protein
MRQIGWWSTDRGPYTLVPSTSSLPNENIDAPLRPLSASEDVSRLHATMRFAVAFVLIAAIMAALLTSSTDVMHRAHLVFGLSVVCAYISMLKWSGPKAASRVYLMAYPIHSIGLTVAAAIVPMPIAAAMLANRWVAVRDPTKALLRCAQGIFLGALGESTHTKLWFASVSCMFQFVAILICILRTEDSTTADALVSLFPVPFVLAVGPAVIGLLGTIYMLEYVFNCERVIAKLEHEGVAASVSERRVAQLSEEKERLTWELKLKVPGWDTTPPCFHDHSTQFDESSDETTLCEQALNGPASHLDSSSSSYHTTKVGGVPVTPGSYASSASTALNWPGPSRVS